MPSSFGYNLTKTTDILHEDLHAFLCIRQSNETGNFARQNRV